MLVIKQFGPVTYAMGTLQEILAGTGIAAKVRALPNDVAGCTLEMGADGKWVGTLGSLSKATADALVASGAMASVAVGTPGNIAGVHVVYGPGVGWRDQAETYIKPAMVLPGLGSLAGGNDVGFAERYLCEEPFWGFRIRYINQSSNTGIIKASTWSVAPSLNATGSQVNPASVTISGTAINNTTIAGGGAGGIPSYTLSDVIFCDRPTGGVIEIRTNTAAGFTVNYLLAGTGDALPNGITRTYSSTPLDSGDSITGNPSRTFPDNGLIGGVTLVEFFTYAKKKVCVAVGDSLTKGEAGAQTGLGTNSPLFMASRINKSLSAVTYGAGGRALSDSIAAAQGVISNLQPDVLVVSSWSPNEGISAAISGYSISRTIELVNLAARAGIRTVVTTPVPWGYSGANLIAWQNLVASVKKLQGCIVADITTTLEDPSNPGNLKPEYLGSALDIQKLHPNPAGKYAQAVVLAQVLGNA